jgi:hypothetical protein
MYYPSPAVLLYLVSRAAVWGDIPALLALKAPVLAQLARCPAGSVLDLLCRESALRLWGGASGYQMDIPTPTGEGAFYVGPLLAWPLQRFAPLQRVATHGSTHIRFRSEALEWALFHWLQQAA